MREVETQFQRWQDVYKLAQSVPWESLEPQIADLEVIRRDVE